MDMNFDEKTARVANILALAAALARVDHGASIAAALAMVCSAMAHTEIGPYQENEDTAAYFEKAGCFTEMINTGYEAMRDVLHRHLAAARNRN